HPADRPAGAPRGADRCQRVAREDQREAGGLIMKLVLVKQTDAKLELGTPEADAMRLFLFEMVRGATDKDQRAWSRFIRAINEASQGEYFQIDLKRTRNSAFHRLIFAVMTTVYAAQDLFDDLELLRADLNGEWKAIPRSQNFEEASEEEVRDFFEKMCTFMRSATCCAALWPEAPIESSMEGMLKILSRFDHEAYCHQYKETP